MPYYGCNDLVMCLLKYVEFSKKIYCINFAPQEKKTKGLKPNKQILSYVENLGTILMKKKKKEITFCNFHKPIYFS